MGVCILSLIIALIFGTASMYIEASVLHGIKSVEIGITWFTCVYIASTISFLTDPCILDVIGCVPNSGGIIATFGITVFVTIAFWVHAILRHPIDLKSLKYISK